MRALGAILILGIVSACAGPAVSPAPGSPHAASPAPPSPSPTSSTVALAGPVTEVRSSVGRQSVDAATEQQLAELVRADADFAARLYRQIAAGQSGNVFISPYSISTALSMAYPGARGNTAAEMKQVIGIWDDQPAWHSARNRLEIELAALATAQYGAEGNLTPLTLSPANTMFGQQNYPFKSDFLDVLAADYGAGMQTVDFAGATEDARLAVNEWVADRTNDRIKDILAKGDVDDLTRFVLVNAIYFQANWRHEFSAKETQTEPFHGPNGHSGDVSMMHGEGKLGYLTGPGWQAVRIPYFGASMLVIVPDDGRFAEVEAKIDAQFLSDLTTNPLEAEVKLGLPRWDSETRSDLIDALRSMGIVDLFDSTKADLSGIADVEPIYASHVVHEANISVDEQGTEAAASTALVGEAVSGAQLNVTLTIDRPFLYLIQADTTTEILFMGRFVGPEG